MITVTYPDIQDLARYVVGNDFFVVGELHGIEQNASVVKGLLEASAILTDHVTVAFEWLLTDTELLSVRSFIDGSINRIKTPAFFQDSDGRVTVSHVALLQHIRVMNQKRPGSVTVYTFDMTDESSELAMANTLMAIRQEVKGPILIETGSVHAEKRPISIPETMSQILSSKHSVFSTFLRYETGQVNIEGELYDVRDAETQQTDISGAFDAEIHVPAAEPAIELPSLTIY
jgi:hypothetical protein